MQLKIKQVSAIAPRLLTQQDFETWAHNPQFEQCRVDVPKLESIPMMQRRRLSQFAKLCCFSLNQLNLTDTPEIIFASRFGDLEKTDLLIQSAAMGETLSPAQFGLSVHNAVAGQYSIFTNNKSPSNTLSAGIDTFHFALLDAYARLTQTEQEQIVIVCTESIPPSKYHPYIQEQLIEHSVAIVLSKTEGQTFEFQCQANTESATQNEQPIPQALSFLAWFYQSNNNTSPSKTINSPHYQWHWQHV